MSEINVLEKASSLAAEKLKAIKAPAEAKAAEEAKVASEDKAKADEQQKKDEGIALAKVEAQKKEDERILVADDKTLSEPEVKRKAELQETKRKKDESPDEKIKRVQEASQKRIDEIKSEMLAKENQSAERLKKLEAELAELKRPKVEEDFKARLKREESERVAKYVEEDKDKPKEERREMSKDQLEEWYLEDPVEATAWMQERTLRRAEERKTLEKKSGEESGKELSEEFIRKQNESKEKLFAKYPGVNPTKERLAELKGKTSAEINKILSEENEEFRICSEIVMENPKKYIESENGPEMIMAEMEKRLKVDAKPKTVTLTEEELEAKIQAEAERRALLSGEGASSSTKGKKVENKNVNTSEQRQHLERIAKKAKIPMVDLDKTIERRKSIPGAGSFNISGVDEG